MIFRPSLLFVAVAAFFANSLTNSSGAPWNYTGGPDWNPPVGVVGAVYPPPSQAFPMEATVSETPPQITLTIYSGSTPTNSSQYDPNLSGTYDIFRKAPDAAAWGAPIGTVTVGTSNATWTDTNVVVGQLYEYGLAATGTTVMKYGFLVAGIKADQTQPRGRLALVVADDVIANLPSEYARYKRDMVADGWFVHEIPVARAPDYTSNGTGPNDSLGVPTAPFPTAHVDIRNQIIALHNQYPGEFKNVVLLGKVPVPRSGHRGIGPDGHGNQAALGADAYYGDMDGIWPDEKSNAPFLVAGTPITGFVNNADGSVTLPSSAFPISQYYLDLVKAKRLAGGGPHLVYAYPYRFTVLNGDVTEMASSNADSNLSVKGGTVNVPGDNKFDDEYMDEIRPNSDVELGFGRIDFSNSVPAEYEALRTYFNKLHRYRTASPDFRPARKVIHRTGFGMVSRACLEGMAGIVGMTEIDWIKDADLPAVPNSNYDADSAYTATDSCLFYFKGGGGPDFSDGGKAVFWTGMQSHWGYWFVPGAPTSGQNAMQRRLSEDNFTLSFTWSIGLLWYDTSYLYHRMGMGFDAGDMMRISMSSRGGSGAPAGFVPLYAKADSPLFMDHMGDPTLRLFRFAPPAGLSVVAAGGHPSLSWTASSEQDVVGYHVYRASTPEGPFTRLTSAPLAPTSYVDSTVSAGIWSYMVRAIRLETTGGGTFYNPSLGIQQSIDLTNGPAPLQIATTSLPDAYWDTAYTSTLEAQAGTPLYGWSITSGGLPPGLTLSPDGVISGHATAGGEFSFTVQALDATGQIAQKPLSITAQSNNQTTFEAEANRYVSGYNSNSGSFYEPALKLSGPTYLYQPFLRFDLSSLDVNNSFVRAKLVLTFDESSQADSHALVKVALTEDSGDDWDESTLTYANRPLDQISVLPVSADAYPVPFGTLEIDVTSLVRETLQNDPARKVSLRLFTNAPASFGQEVQISTRYASANARPRLIIETSDAPEITITSPTVNPVSLHAGTALQLSATVVAIPELAGSLSVQWSQVSGPGVATFTTSSQTSTGVSFSAAGDYVLRLTANDGVLQSYRNLTVRVLSVQMGTAPVTGPDDGLILRLPFDETSGLVATDLSGVAPPNDGTLATITADGDLPLWSPAGGKAGGAIVLDGTNQRVEIEDSVTSPLDGMEKLTASLWVKATTLDANSRAILVKRTSSSSSSTSYAITLNSSRQVVAAISNKAGAKSNFKLTAGEWCHIAMVFDGSLATDNLQLYINGDPETFLTVTGLAGNKVPRISASKLRIGDYTATVITGANKSLDGAVDEVRIYNRVLTLAEIQDLAAAAPSNVGPRITLSGSVNGTAGQPFQLTAMATDDGSPGPLAFGWSRVSGPGSVDFGSPSSISTTATAFAGGNYLLRLIANDGAIATWADTLATIDGSLSGYAQWAQNNGLPIDGTGDGAHDATPANDGIANAIKYALGLEANVPGYVGRFSAGKIEEGGETYLSVTYSHPDPNPAGTSYAVKTCDDLSGWSTVQTEEVSNTVAAGLRTITIRDTVPMSGSETRRFIRLEVAVP